MVPFAASCPPLASLPRTLLDQLAAVPDPRMDRTKRHLLKDMLAITLVASVAGADDYVSIAEFGEAREAWFRTFLELPNGIPSHDTFTRVLGQVNRKAMEGLLVQWSATVARLVQGDVIAIDGKTARRSYTSSADHTSALHAVSAWSTREQLVLGQVQTDRKSNEITAIPELLDLLDIAGCTVTIDAMGCQKAITTAIRKKRAEYVLAVKRNQPWLYARIAAVFSHGDTDATYWAHTPCERWSTVEKDHGRLETRKYTVVPAASVLADQDGWTDVRSIGCVESERTILHGRDRGTTTRETRYFIASVAPQVQRFAHAVRSHWGIENQCHWTLDVVFNEDQNRTRTHHGPANLAIIRKWVLSVLRQDKRYDLTHAPKKRYGLKTRRLMAGWDHTYLVRVLGFAAPSTTQDDTPTQE